MTKNAATDSFAFPAGFPLQPGKIIAVHLSYDSRAAQRGRKPKTPSYFFKPLSSLAGSGETIERPKGAELLAFEGEIALVIGTPTRWVSEDAAWSHVGWVSAANDFGIYDMRKADKGSNVRSKGGDGYTPVGPDFIPATDLDPADISVTTWVNGEVAQQDSSAGMFFSLPRLVADLSQHFTLQPGDIILTGTPAGSSVVVPGDTVEVEVSGNGQSSGRLATTVTQGEHAFDPALGDVPATDSLQVAEAWGTPPEPVLTEALKAALIELPTAAISAQLRKMGLNNVTIDGVAAMHPETKMVGVAKTLRFLPNREDLFKKYGGGHNAQKRAFDALTPGDVMVIEARGEAGSGTLGDILALRAKALGAAGIVTDGGVRDYTAVADVDIPVYTRGAHPAVLGRKHFPWEVGGTVACGGTTVVPGDIIVGDRDGVIVIPSDLVVTVVEEAQKAEESDAWVAEQVAAGFPIEGLFPMNDEWKERYRQWKQN
ncbi:fumarylacetoacetate hydrolase family protein [Actinomyces minihominis]|uniref:fumarylacetoacetate hydrolase family protein n=1 Tax=Actinomyces minihominis TaxID=2002838 RepID=UPI000C06EECD|nr:fumarylacetoacetate hydrolase family protein [Actinomyces minihominis]